MRRVTNEPPTHSAHKRTNTPEMTHAEIRTHTRRQTARQTDRQTQSHRGRDVEAILNWTQNEEDQTSSLDVQILCRSAGVF
mmetsp:Transcript_5404/g.14955  ORF Transcript_5404/g.14955 Transcript_5404/m.14955 type:complete len:81 (+) Transcript_5404:290-532(+)